MFKEKIPEVKFDIRLQERNRKMGLVNQKDYKKWLSGLADASENVDFIRSEDIFDEEPEEKSEEPE